jgi:precorrin-6A synthase
MRKVLIIGVGAGDPDYITIQAIKALNQVDVFFVIDKGAAKDDLVQLRKEICARHITGSAYRFVEAGDPARDRTPKDSSAYAAAVSAWHDARAAIFESMISTELADDGVGAFLVWGDPSLYDSTLAILADVLARGGETFEVDVIPGISSVSQLAARHRTGLNQVGGAVQITTGRRLASGWPAGVDDVVVMLDAHNAFTGVEDAEIFWGAYLGTPDEILVSGPLPEVAEEIVTARAEARRRKGWIMDTYLLRRTRG